jgi:hypothetical protein
MNIGLFLLIEPFASVENQLKLVSEMGFNFADITVYLKDNFRGETVQLELNDIINLISPKTDKGIFY